MIFIETPFFEEDIQQLMPDEAYGDLQRYLADQPDAGDLILRNVVENWNG